MKITINVDDSATETSLLLTCKELTPEVEKILAAIRIIDKQLTAKKNGSVCLLDLSKIFYIEAMERTTLSQPDPRIKSDEQSIIKKFPNKTFKTFYD